MSVRLLSNQNVQDSWVETLPVGGRLRVQTTPLDECLYFEKLPKTRSSYLLCHNVGRKSLRISERTASVYRWFPRSVQCKFQLGSCRSYARTWLKVEVTIKIMIKISWTVRKSFLVRTIDQLFYSHSEIINRSKLSSLEVHTGNCPQLLCTQSESLLKYH